jgi:hypothetical protein
MTMKKLLIPFLLLIGVGAGAQGVKISAMPTLTDQASINASWVPVVYNLVNYKANPTWFNKDRIDSIVNNWPVGGGGDSLFGVSGGDDQATQVRDFDQNGNTFTIHGAAFTHGTGDYTGFASAFSILSTDAGYFDAYGGNGTSTDDYRIQGYRNTTGGRVDLSASSPAGQAAIQLGNNVGWSSLVHFFAPTGNLRISTLIDSAQASVLYYNVTNGKVTYGAAPSGGGGGIQSIAGTNGTTVVNDSIVKLGGALIEATAISGLSNTNTLTISGTYTSTNMVNITNSSTGTSLGVSNNGGSSTASFFNSGSGVVLNLTATSGTAMTATTTSGSEAARITVNPSSTNTTVTVLNVRRLTSGTAAANMAGSIEYNMEVNLDGSSTAVSNKLISMWTDAANATRGSKFIIQGVTNAVNTDVVEFLGDGNVRQLVTGKGYGLKSPDGTTWYITVNNSGVLSTSTTAP